MPAALSRARGAGWAVALAMILAALPLLWEIAVATIFVVVGRPPDELPAVAMSKLGFAAALAIGLSVTHAWRSAGFCGGLGLRLWWLAWPLWLGAAISLLQIDGPIDVAHGAGWFAVALGVAFGEEGMFRGVVLTALGGFGPRSAVVASACLFGAAHLIGLLAPIDPRMIAAQALLAAGLGLSLGAVRLRSRSIWPGFAAHATLDFLALLASDGIGAALEYSPAALDYWLGSAAIALAWGTYLLYGLPRDKRV